MIKKLQYLNAIALKTWLVATCSIEDNQLHFRVDGFPMIKFQITKGGNLKIIYNRCKDEPRFSEDAAFQFASFAVGKIVSWEKFAKYLKAWAKISNLRATLATAAGYPKFVFNPQGNWLTISWHDKISRYWIEGSP